MKNMCKILDSIILCVQEIISNYFSYKLTHVKAIFSHWVHRGKHFSFEVFIHRSLLFHSPSCVYHFGGIGNQTHDTIAIMKYFHENPIWRAVAMVIAITIMI